MQETRRAVHERLCVVGPASPYSAIIGSWQDYIQSQGEKRAEFDAVLEPWRLCFEELYGDAVDAFTARIHVEDELKDHLIVRRAIALWSLRNNSLVRLELPKLEAIAEGHHEAKLLAATAAMIIAKWHSQYGNKEAAFSAFEKGFSLCPVDHPLRCELLDALGVLCSRLSQSFISRLAFQASLQIESASIESRLSCYGRYGSALYELGLFDQAEKQFRKQLRVATDHDCRLDQAQAMTWMGRILMGRAKLLPPKSTEITLLVEEAEKWLGDSLKLSELYQLKTRIAYCHLDLADAWLMRDRIPDSDVEHSIGIATQEFSKAGFSKGLACAYLLLGKLYDYRLQANKSTEENEESALFASCREQFFRSIELFRELNDHVGLARARGELVRCMRHQGFSKPVLLEAIGHAMDEAEKHLRRNYVLRELEIELMKIDSVTFNQRCYEKSRGRNTSDEARGYVEPKAEVATVLFLDLVDSSRLTSLHDLETTIDLLNTLMGEFYSKLSPYQARIEFRGDGFLAAFQGPWHTLRAFQAARETILAVSQINRQFQWVGLPQIAVRCGIATADVVFGCIGSIEKVDSTCIGPAANLAARLQSEAGANMACLNRFAFEILRELGAARDRVPSAPSAPLKGFENETSIPFSRNAELQRSVRVSGFARTLRWGFALRLNCYHLPSLSHTYCETGLRPKTQRVSCLSRKRRIFQAEGRNMNCRGRKTTTIGIELR
jgi:class 3 adenylate cyclase/tetratricopeptide (TPR) repeat protein